MGFGTVGTCSRLFYDHGGDSYTILWLRFVISAPIFVLIALARREPFPNRRGLLGGLGIGAFQFAGAYAIFEGYARAPVALVVLLFYIYPLIVTVGAAVLFHEEFGIRRVAVLAGGLAGIALIVGAPEEASGLGIALGLSAAVCISVTILWGRPLMVSAGLTPTWLMALMIGGPAVALALAVPAHAPGLGFGIGAWGLAFALVIGSGVVALLFFYTGVKLIGASTASLLGNVEPLVSVLLAYAVLGESLSALQLAGGALIIASVVALSLQTRERESVALASQGTDSG